MPIVLSTGVDGVRGGGGSNRYAITQSSRRTERWRKRRATQRKRRVSGLPAENRSQFILRATHAARGKTGPSRFQERRCKYNSEALCDKPVGRGFDSR
jgi:hypothetical protein